MESHIHYIGMCISISVRVILSESFSVIMRVMVMPADKPVMGYV